MANVRIRHRSATYTEWFTANPILSVREIAYEHPDTGIGTGPVKSKQGDGVTPWNNLPYSTPAGGGGSGTNEVILTEDKTKKFYIAGTQSDITNTGTLTFNNKFYISETEGLRTDKITMVSDINNGIFITNKSGGTGIVCTNELLLVETETNVGFVCNNICNEINKSSIGFHVPVNGGYGFKIDTNIGNGFYIEENNSAGFSINKNNNSTILINENNGTGLLILKNNSYGIQINDNINTAIQLNDNSNTGIRIINKIESPSSQGIEFILSTDSNSTGNKAIHITGNSVGYFGGYGNRYYYPNTAAIKIEGGIDNAIEATNSKASFRELNISRYGGDFKNGVVGIKINGGPAGNCIEMTCYGAGSYTDDIGNVIETRNDGIKIDTYSSANGIVISNSGNCGIKISNSLNSSSSSGIYIENTGNGKAIDILTKSWASAAICIHPEENNYNDFVLKSQIYLETEQDANYHGMTIWHKSAKYGLYIVHDPSSNYSDFSSGLRLVSTKGTAMSIFIDSESSAEEHHALNISLRGDDSSTGINIVNYCNGSSILLESEENSGKSIYIKNNSGLVGQLIENVDNTYNSLYATIGLSVINNNYGHGIAILNKTNNGIGLSITNQGTNHALYIDSSYNGVGLYIDSSISQTAIWAKGISELKTIKTDNIIFNNDLSSISKSSLGIDINSSATHTVSFIENCLSPKVDSDIDLGSATLRWNNIYAASSTISTSDKNKKKNVKVITSKSAKSIINGLSPVTYEYKDGTSGRRHYGLLAQDVEELITKLGISDKDFGALVKSPKYNEDGTIDGYDYGLRYEEFISILVKELQNQNKELNDLKKEIKSIKEFIKM